MLRFPLSILVVFVHSYGPDIDIAQLHANGFTGAAFYDYVRIFFSVVIARSAVPIFFIISGYLFYFQPKINLLSNLSLYALQRKPLQQI